MTTLEHWATHTPDALAVVDGERSLTYAQWDHAANQLADALHEDGIRPGMCVAVRLRLRSEWFIANRAIGKVGAEHLAVNWRLTPTEAAALVRTSGAAALICDDPDPSMLLALTADQALHTTMVIGASSSPADPFSTRWRAAFERQTPTPRIGPERVPLVIFTSGTTGQPKTVARSDGIDVDPARTEAYYHDIATRPPRPDRSHTLLALPMHHSAGPLEALRTHMVGGTVYLMDRFDAREAVRAIDMHKIDQWLAVPTMLQRVRSLPADTLAGLDLSSIRTLITGAAPVPQSLKEWVLATFGAGVLWEQYGSTEAGAISVLPPHDQLRKPGSSGLPLPGVLIRIVDQAWNSLPPGVTGAIAVNTPALVSKYRGQPPMGPEVMSADQFYRTGDVGHLDEDGYLYITDREKDMIVAGGVNIYPAEIEAALDAHPDIVDSAVIGVPDADLGEQPVAFLEVRDGVTLTLPNVLDFLGDRLARYKHPRQIEVLVSLPRNGMGKVVKGDLRRPYWQGRERQV